MDRSTIDIPPRKQDNGLVLKEVRCLVRAADEKRPLVQPRVLGRQQSDVLSVLERTETCGLTLVVLQPRRGPAKRCRGREVTVLLEA